ncbi:hypothetical protein A2771_03730 [Candidatus Woesebacteria bacterium RIFCSPHIGHO2_01_FULL_38_26b]|uniref:CAAX prenyl protease 2/Lysostaphin resistance protein A-like domain-containing protein n=1 Tax=Candidatus Woesebacteria bacterium RIFCSPHIGHO2_01_FULL_38_26b TaxID=1802491 RepID=A0A1F7XX92_9BACT|nr:MAG: hypothetical protein A2771_03730 [Candidatus Woesebacteria bacterium RIFCSPHIGHO2_01_FULL_38_26b]
MYPLEDKREGSCYLITAFFAFLIIILVEWIWPDVIPFTLFEYWKLNGSISQILKALLPLLVFGIILNVIMLVRTRNDPLINQNAEVVFGIGCGLSTFAGIFEEISFRWILFYDQIIVYKILNWLFFGFAGWGFFEWFFNHISGPIANFLTLGYLEPYLFNGLGWFIGAAIISSNAKFRNGHLYQGWFGWINAWFGGMYFFYLMFNYGLIASILAHFLYDLFCFGLLYIDAAIERKLGWV